VSTTCRAALVVEFGQPLTVEDVEVPELEPGGVLVEVEAATLCGTDVHFWQHGQAFLGADSLPYIPGHETCGRIVAVSGEPRDNLNEPLAVGDRIIGAYPYCGHCFYCTVAMQPTLCSWGFRYGRERADRYPFLLGGCAELHYYPPGCDLIRVPETVPSELAASAACALRTVMHGFERLGPLAGYETVVVQGSGPVGLYAAAVARTRGADRVLVVGAPAPRLAVAKSFGADEVIDLEEVDDAGTRQQWVLDQTSGRGADVVVQCATSAAIPEGVGYLRPGGRYVSIGAGGADPGMPTTALFKHVTFSSVLMAEGRHFYEAIRFLDSHGEDFPFGEMITGRYGLAGLSDALEAMAAYREVKPVVVPG